jgi:hypothetical protein
LVGARAEPLRQFAFELLDLWCRHLAEIGFERLAGLKLFAVDQQGVRP